MTCVTGQYGDVMTVHMEQILLADWKILKQAIIIVDVDPRG